MWRRMDRCTSHSPSFSTFSPVFAPVFFFFTPPHAFCPRVCQYDVAQLQGPSTRMAACYLHISFPRIFFSFPLSLLLFFLFTLPHVFWPRTRHLSMTMFTALSMFMDDGFPQSNRRSRQNTGSGNKGYVCTISPDPFFRSP
jgi:hypothetical protein